MSEAGAPRRLLPAAIRNALVWGAAWGGLAFVAFAVFKLAGIGGPGASWSEGLGLAGRFGVIGTVAGMAFATVIRAAYRGRRLAGISWWRFGLGGGVVTALFIPCFLSVMRLVTGEGILPLEYWLPNMTVGALFGGTVAGGTIKAAQIADRMLQGGGGADIGAGQGADRLVPPGGP